MLMPVGTILVFALVIFFGLTVSSALATTRVLAAIELALAGGIFALNLKYRRQLNQWLDAADTIEAKICRDDVFSDWDEFIAGPAGDPEVERVRVHCLGLPQEFPPAAPDEYCNEQGVEVLQGYVRRLRAGLATRAVEGCSGWWRGRQAARKPADADGPPPADTSGAGRESILYIPDPVPHPAPTRLPERSRRDEAASIKLEQRETEELAATLPDDEKPESARKRTTKPTTTKKAKKRQTAKKVKTAKKPGTNKKARTNKKTGTNRKAA